MEKAFSTDEYSEEDLKYVAEVFRHVSYKTIWRTFDSCNNYSMPEKLAPSCKVHYWYGSAEEKDRKWDIRYFKEVLPQTVFEKFDGMGHASMASLYPELFAERLRSVIAECKSGQQA